MITTWFRAASLAVAMLAATTAAVAEAADPAIQPVQAFYDTLLATMKQGRQLGVRGRYERLKPVIEQSFDMPGMTRLSVGPAWNTMTPAEQQGLVAALTRYTAASYASNFKSFDGERFVVDPAVTLRGSDKVVTTKLIAGSTTVSFNYRMRQVGASWKVIDIFLAGFVSQVARQRSDYSATVASGGAAALEHKLNALSDNLMRD
jgi:phospholipid transport system substrate-binding protein